MPTYQGFLQDTLGSRLDFAGDSCDNVVVTAIPGWYDGSTIRGDRVNRLYDGMFDPIQRLDGRQLTLTGFKKFSRCSETPAEDAAEFARKLAAMLAPGEGGDGWGLLKLTDGIIVPMECKVFRDGQPRIDIDREFHIVNFELPLLAPDPRLYGPEMYVTVADFSYIGGFEFPAFLPGYADWGGEVVGELGEPMLNRGTYPSYPVFVVEGDYPGGFEVGFGDRFATFEDPVVSGVPVTVDFSGRVFVGGYERMMALGGRRWGGVGPMEAVSPYFMALGGGTGSAKAYLRSVWL